MFYNFQNNIQGLHHKFTSFMGSFQICVNYVIS